MTARPDAPAPSESKLSPKAAELGGLAAMRQTLNDFSLESLSSLLDDELTLEPSGSSTPASAPQATGGAPKPVAPAPPQFAFSAPPLAPVPTEFVATQPVPPPPAATLPVAIPSPRLSAVTEPVSVVARRSSLDETQLYKSTPQPTIDLATVRKSAHEPTQAFGGDLAAFIDASSTMPAAIDPSRSSAPETTFWTSADRDSALLESTTGQTAFVDPPPFAATPEPPPFVEPSAFAEPPAFASESASATAPAENVAEAPAMTEPHTIARQLAGFFTGQPRRSTDVRWEQSVDSDRQMTTMLLSELDERPDLPIASGAGSAAAYADAPAPPFAPSTGYEQSYEKLEVVEPAVAPAASAAPAPARLSDLHASQVDPAAPVSAAANIGRGRAGFLEPSPEIRQLATYLLERSTPGVPTAVAVLGCDETRAGAEATLALAAAVADATGVSTLVVDADFAKRDLSRAANAVEAPGFAETLGQPMSGRSFAQSVGRDNLQLLPAGLAAPDANEIPARVSAWMARAKHEHGLILVWLGAASGEFERRLCGAADLSLLLAAVDRDRPSKIEAAAERLRSVNARTLGVALVQA